MAGELSAAQARTVSTGDLIVYNEIDYISRQIYAAALNGDLQTTIDDGTTMTDSTPTITVTGTVSNPVVGAAPESLTINGEGISLPADDDVDQIVAAINDAAIAGLTASKNEDSQIVLTYEPTQTNWALAIDGDSANPTVGFTTGSYAATPPASVDYYNVWSNLETDRKLSYHMTQVINHFQNLGFSILQKKNTETSNTFKWEVYW